MHRCIAQSRRQALVRQAIRVDPECWLVLGYTIASEIGDIHRFTTPKNLCGYTGLSPRVYQSGSKDHRGPLANAGPKYLRWALIEAAIRASKHPAYRDHYERTAARLGKQRGKKVARVEVARKLAEARPLAAAAAGLSAARSGRGY